VGQVPDLPFSRVSIHSLTGAVQLSPMRQSLCEKSYDRRNRLSHRSLTAWFAVVGQAVPPANGRLQRLFTQTSQRGATSLGMPPKEKGKVIDR
jgi:hypothetical protein